MPKGALLQTFAFLEEEEAQNVVAGGKKKGLRAEEEESRRAKAFQCNGRESGCGGGPVHT